MGHGVRHREREADDPHHAVEGDVVVDQYAPDHRSGRAA